MIITEADIADAMTRKCGLCGAKPGKPCVNRMRKPPTPLTDRACHFYRIEPK